MLTFLSDMMEFGVSVNIFIISCVYNARFSPNVDLWLAITWLSKLMSMAKSPAAILKPTGEGEPFCLGLAV